MPDMDLVQRLRDYARGPGRAAVVVSSAWLAREFGVDPRTIAAAVRPYGVQPGEVERGVRGYSTADLGGMVLPGDEPDVLEGRIPLEVAAVDWKCPDCDVAIGVEHDDGCDVARCQVTGLQRLSCGDDHDCGADVWTGTLPGVEAPDAVAVLSAAAGHDMTPALRAAGLL